LNRPELSFLKAKDGEPVFGEPWHAQTLALADLLVKSGAISSARWAETLGAEIKALNAAPDDRETYFRAVLAALERLLAENGSVTHAELEDREHQWERAYLRTPHGKPVELAAGMEPDWEPSGRQSRPGV
jgi:nitrile hydratase accessory protein